MALAWKAGWVNSPRGFESRILRQPSPALPRRAPRSSTVGISLWVLRLPAPGVGAHLVDRPGCGPAQLGLGLRGVGVRLGDVAAAARGDLVREVAAARAGEGPQHLHDRARPAGAEVPGRDRLVGGCQTLEGGDVAGGEVLDVQVVAAAGAVGRGVVVAVDEDLLAAADGDLGEQ